VRTLADTVRKHTGRWVTYEPVRFAAHAEFARETLDAIFEKLMPSNCLLCRDREHFGPCKVEARIRGEA
jgi:hypothetical protein